MFVVLMKQKDYIISYEVCKRTMGTFTFIVISQSAVTVMRWIVSASSGCFNVMHIIYFTFVHRMEAVGS